VLPYEPRVIVFYAGDNDIAAGASPEIVLFDFHTFVELVHDKLSDTRILFLSIKPSPVRHELWGRMQEANRLIESLCSGDYRLRYVDVATAMLDAEGNPRRELFLEDGLHMNTLGYRLWTEVVSPVVEQSLLEL
jgi:lysophospholipase L1-like esterase